MLRPDNIRRRCDVYCQIRAPLRGLTVVTPATRLLGTGGRCCGFRNCSPQLHFPGWWIDCGYDMAQKNCSLPLIYTHLCVCIFFYCGQIYIACNLLLSPFWSVLSCGVKYVHPSPPSIPRTFFSSQTRPVATKPPLFPSPSSWLPPPTFCFYAFDSSLCPM